ncbi:DUF3365 domain-containing protein [Desulfococcaceae bacterium HSG9]|nr:DUF3365 domain-containing protein [Desulfococcaceae bacterium HSG9]
MKIKRITRLRYKIIALSVWTVLLAMLLGWNLYNTHQTAVESAKVKARALWDKDIIFRIWNARHGGVYAPITETTPPNPYLEVPERDIKTPKGKQLTLINPAYMTRQIYEIAEAEYAIKGHITSLKPLRPENKPDDWETEALNVFEKGWQEYSTIDDKKGQQYLRLMKPLITQQACLKCHESQGYKVGDVRGGISIKVSMEDFHVLARQNAITDILAYLMIWAVGVISIFWMANVFKHNLQEIQTRQRQLENTISAQTLAEEGLRESEERYSNIIAGLGKVGVGLFIVDEDRRVRYMNKVMIDWFGDQKGKICYQSVAGLNSECAYCQIDSVIGRGQTARYQPTTPDGRTFDIQAVPLQNKDGSISKMEIIRNITDQKQAEQELLKLRKLESVGVLAGGIAHDFNNLLTGLSGNIELARMSLSTDHKAYKFLDYAERSMESAAKLSTQLLTFSKGGDPIKEPLSIGAVITETAQFAIRGSRVQLQTGIASDLWPVEADKGQLGQVIINLIINAQQAMPDGGVITINAENVETSDGRHVQITVKDNGVGIASEYLDKIFDPYFSTKQKGSGLGLASAHSIISKHNGTITVDSLLNKGSTFTIRLPATEKTVIEKPTAETYLVDVSSVRILVLDDDEAVREITAAMLEKLGHEATFAVDGQEAVAKYRKAHQNETGYDMVIADLTIPGGMGGQEATREILKIDPQAKIIVSSGYATDPVMANYKEYGFQGRAEKPYRLAELRKVIQQVLKT